MVGEIINPDNRPKPDPVSLDAAMTNLIEAATKARGYISTYPPRKLLRDAIDLAQVSLDEHRSTKHSDVKMVKE